MSTLSDIMTEAERHETFNSEMAALQSVLQTAEPYPVGFVWQFVEWQPLLKGFLWVRERSVYEFGCDVPGGVLRTWSQREALKPVEVIRRKRMSIYTEAVAAVKAASTKREAQLYDEYVRLRREALDNYVTVMMPKPDDESAEAAVSRAVAHHVDLVEHEDNRAPVWVCPENIKKLVAAARRAGVIEGWQWKGFDMSTSTVYLRPGFGGCKDAWQRWQAYRSTQTVDKL